MMATYITTNITTTTTIATLAQFLIHCKYYDECGVCMYEHISTLLSYVHE
jgi:hypothetical protein